MFISVIIPAKSVSNYLVNETLPSFNKQKYSDFEVILIIDQKNVRDQLLEKKYTWLTILESRNNGPAKKRNKAVSVSKGKIICFIDDDAFPSNSWLKNIDKLSRKAHANMVFCGPSILPVYANFWEKVFNQVLISPVGSGEINYRFKKGNERIVDDFPVLNFVIRKSKFKNIGGFPSDTWPGEDSQFCHLLINNGVVINYTPRLLIYHHRKSSLIDHLRQHARYGYQRGFLFQRGDANSKKVFYFIPSLFIIYLVFLHGLALAKFFFIFNKALTKFVFLPILGYFVMQFVLFIQAYKNTKKVYIAFWSSLTLLLTHITYGIIFIIGNIDYLLKKGQK